MKKIDNNQLYNILHNLSNLEISFMEYSVHAKDFSRYQTYFKYLDNYTIRTHNLWEFYFSLLPDTDDPQSISVRENDVLSEASSIHPSLDFSVGKLFNFPDGPMHKCEYYTFIYAMEGTGKLSLTNTAFSLTPGDFYLIPPMTDYALGIEPECIMLFFNLRKTFVQSEYEMIFQNDQRLVNFIVGTFDGDPSLTYLSLHSDNSKQVQSLTLEILREYLNQEKFCRNAMKQYLCLLFTQLLRQNAPITSSQSVSRTIQHYQQILDYLTQNYQTADLTSAADAIHFSKQYVCRIVREASGTTFNSLLMKTRLEMVCSYLLQSNLSIEKITELCGFSTPSHLSRSFKQHYGISPSEFKKANRA